MRITVNLGDGHLAAGVGSEAGPVRGKLLAVSTPRCVVLDEDGSARGEGAVVVGVGEGEDGARRVICSTRCGREVVDVVCSGRRRGGCDGMLWLCVQCEVFQQERQVPVLAITLYELAVAVQVECRVARDLVLITKI
jgi:hypothetical protein